jgi:hypothetical protein
VLPKIITHEEAQASRAKKGKLYCICREPNDKNKPMVRCDDCKQWFHIKCLVDIHVPLDLGVDGDLKPNADAFCFPCWKKRDDGQQQQRPQQPQRSAVQPPPIPPPPPVFAKSKSKPAVTPMQAAKKPAAKPPTKRKLADESTDDAADDHANASTSTKNRRIADGPLHSKRVPVPKKK